HDPRGLLGAPEIARVDGVERLLGELRREAARLFAPGLVERAVGVALEAPVEIPVRLAVPHEEDPGHAVRLATPWTSACAIASASSPVRPAVSVSRRRACSSRRVPAS